MASSTVRVVLISCRFHEVNKCSQDTGQYWCHCYTPVGLAILTFPEDAAVLGVLECSPQPGAVGGGDGGLELGPGPALHQVQLLALEY